MNNNINLRYDDDYYIKNIRKALNDYMTHVISKNPTIQNIVDKKLLELDFKHIWNTELKQLDNYDDLENDSLLTPYDVAVGVIITRYIPELIIK